MMTAGNSFNPSAGSQAKMGGGYSGPGQNRSGGGSKMADQYWPTGGQADQFGAVPGSLSAGIRAMQTGQPGLGQGILRGSAGLNPFGSGQGGSKMGGGYGGGQQFGGAPVGPPDLGTQVGGMQPMQPGAGYNPMGRGQTPGFNAPPAGGFTNYGPGVGGAPPIGYIGGMQPPGARYSQNMAMPTGGLAGQQFVNPAYGMPPPAYAPPPSTVNDQGQFSNYQQFVGRPMR